MPRLRSTSSTRARRMRASGSTRCPRARRATTSRKSRRTLLRSDPSSRPRGTSAPRLCTLRTVSSRFSPFISSASSCSSRTGGGPLRLSSASAQAAAGGSCTRRGITR
eukprot:Amastigsp_a201_582.p4 type:complete len:108 gc:universal Amastigsp_a201_582:175-498(+)